MLQAVLEAWKRKYLDPHICMDCGKGGIGYREELKYIGGQGYLEHWSCPKCDKEREQKTQAAKIRR